MTEKDDALKLARGATSNLLAAIRGGAPDLLTEFLETKSCEALDAINKALAQPEQPAHQEPNALAAYVIGCFSAADSEGLTEVLAETTDERLKDLVERRLMYAWYEAQKVQSVQQEPVGTMVSMDVSKLDEPEYRIFGRIYEVMRDGKDEDEVTYLAIEESRNFETPPQRKPLTDGKMCSMLLTHGWLTSKTLRDTYRLGFRDSEAAHGIKG